MKAAPFRLIGTVTLGLLVICPTDVAEACDRGINHPGAVGPVGVWAPGVGVRDPGTNAPGAMGNVGVGMPGRGFGAPGVGFADPGLNQPGVAGNASGVARRTVRR